jgi:hypothetical protein
MVYREVVALHLVAASVVAQPAMPPARRVVPVRAESVLRAGPKLWATSPWKEIGETPVDRVMAPAFDAYWGDDAGRPTGFCEAGCDQWGYCPCDPGLRWWSGPNYRNPYCINDMVAAPGMGGSSANRVQFAWWWQREVPTRCYIGIFTGDSEFTGCPGNTPPQSGNLGGVVMDMGMLAGSVGGFWYMDVDVSSGGLSWLMPSVGTYSVMLATAFEDGVLTPDQAWGTQPMQWGTGSRGGSSGPMEWDDWRNANGQIEWNECVYYDPLYHCPLPQGAMIAFWAPAACVPNCDGSTVSPVLNANDFQCFLVAYAAGSAYANCDQSTVPPVLNANDFQCFLNLFAAGCGE